eukprot:COSAG06_NODE_563_length_14268_cov_25.500670_6_plen_79_part_00
MEPRDGKFAALFLPNNSEILKQDRLRKAEKQLNRCSIVLHAQALWKHLEDCVHVVAREADAEVNAAWRPEAAAKQQRR